MGRRADKVVAGGQHSLLLKSDGTVVACGDNTYGQCNIPVLDEGLTYSQVAAGRRHSLLLTSDGTVAACGENNQGQCNILVLDEGLTYSQVAASGDYSLLLKSDGTVAACGKNTDGQCNIPVLDEGLTYSQVAAGVYHSLLLTSDGTVAACGANFHGQCNIPKLKTWTEWLTLSSAGNKYVADPAMKRSQPIKVFLAFYDGRRFKLNDVGGETVCELIVDASEFLTDLHMRLARELCLPTHSFDVVFPGGERLSKAVRRQPPS